MRIAFDAKKIVKNFTGIGNYSRNLVNALSLYEPEIECHLMAPSYGTEEARQRLLNLDRLKFHYPAAIYRGLFQEVWRCKNVASDLTKANIDIYHGLSNEIPLGLNGVCKMVVTIHDLIVLRHPELYGKFARYILEKKTRYACYNADIVIAISQQTKADILKYYNIPESKIRVMYQGCDEIFRNKANSSEIKAVKNKYNLPDEYILSVGTFEPRKNHIGIIKALANTANLHLVLAGKPTAYVETLKQCAKSNRVENRVHFISNVPQKELPSLYQGSKVFVYLSYFEGFGIPVLEAITSGVPVIAATGSCLQEAGGPDQLYCNPYDAYEFADKLNAVFKDSELRDRMIEKGFKYSQNFTSDKIAYNMNAIYESLMNSK